jgi:hypothetical protein
MRESSSQETLCLGIKDELICNGKVVPVLLTEHHAMKAYWGSGGIAPLIPDIGTTHTHIQTHTRGGYK